MIIVTVNPFPFLIHLYFYPPVLGSNFDTITAISKDDINPIVLVIPGLTSDSESPVSFICIYFHSFIGSANAFWCNSGISSNRIFCLQISFYSARLEGSCWLCLVYTGLYAFDVVFGFIDLFLFVVHIYYIILYDQ